MNNPKEALEYMLQCFDNGEGSEWNKGDAIADAKAAIPVAELHQEIVDAVFNPTSCNTDDFWEKMHRIRHKLEALK